MPAVFHTIHSRTKKEKRTKKERIDCYYYPPKTPFQLHWSYYKGSRMRVEGRVRRGSERNCLYSLQSSLAQPAWPPAISNNSWVMLP
jgi:hypothetical protein